MRKKPAVYLVVILPILVGGGNLIVAGLQALYMDVTARSEVPVLNEILILLPALVLWVPITLLLANCVLYALPRLRRIADAYSARAEQPGFGGSQRQLGRFSFILAWVCVPLIVLGFVI